LHFLLTLLDNIVHDDLDLLLLLFFLRLDKARNFLLEIDSRVVLKIFRFLLFSLRWLTLHWLHCSNARLPHGRSSFSRDSQGLDYFSLGLILWP